MEKPQYIKDYPLKVTPAIVRVEDDSVREPGVSFARNCNGKRKKNTYNR